MDKVFIACDEAFTHAGDFHTDDVASGAFLRMLNPYIKIIRGFEVPENFEGIVFDIGGGEFDHHDENREMRENGIYFASFGKLWRKYSRMIVSDYVSKAIDEEFICPIDNSDNTGERDTLCSVISNMNGFWNEDCSKDEQDKRYFEAVEIMKKFLERYIAKFEAIEKSQGYVLDCYKWSKDGIVILDKYAPWKETLKNTDVKVVIYPSNRGGWNAERRLNMGFEFPEEWWGKRNLSDVKGFIFCHSSGFMANFETFEDTIDAVCCVMKAGENS